jgi:hypothetical protein
MFMHISIIIYIHILCTIYDDDDDDHDDDDGDDRRARSYLENL